MSLTLSRLEETELLRAVPTIVGEIKRHEAYDRAEDQQLLESGLKALDGREQDIIRLRFYEGQTQTQIANALGISQMHVSRLIRRALETMRAQLEGDADADER